MSIVITISEDGYNFSVLNERPTEIRTDVALGLQSLEPPGLGMQYTRCLVGYLRWLMSTSPEYIEGCATFWKSYEAGHAHPHPPRG